MGNQLDVTMTDSAGFYEFVDLAPGDYYVVFDGPIGLSPTPANQGGDDANDSDADTATGQSQTVTLAPNEHNPTIDAGFYAPASLGDYVWLDVDGNGEQNDGEPGIEGVTLTLVDEGGNVVGTTMTDANGFYGFADLAPGTYTVLAPATGPNTENPSTPTSMTTTLASGDHDPTLDFGYTPILGSLGDFVWEDLDADGVQDINEPGIQDVTVELFDATTDMLIATTTTGPTGEYLFTDLLQGDYYVIFDMPAGFVSTPNDAGGDDDLDSDADTTTGQTPDYTLGLGEHNPTIDAGFYQPASLGDYVWLDVDGDGEQDAAETGIENITVSLLDDMGNVIATTTTDATGFYEFTGLVPGTYTVEVPANGPNSENPSTPISLTTTLQSGQHDPTLDFGYTPILSSLGDFVWEDLNADGVQDINEPGIQDVIVELFDATTGASLGTTTTGPTGEYLFTDLPEGDYYVVFGSPTGFENSPNDAGGDDGIDSDADSTTGQTPDYTLGLGEHNPTIDAGFYQLAGLGDYVLVRCGW